MNLKKFLRSNSINFSVHYWYWNNRENTEKKEGGAASAQKMPDFWTQDRIGQLTSLAEVVESRIRDPRTSISLRSEGFAPLLKAEWLRRFPGCKETAVQLEAMISRAEANQPPTPLQLPWSPKLKQDLRQLRERLEEAGEYLVSRLLEE